MYLAIDPSGTSTTGIFCFWRWDKWEFHNFADPKWERHVDYLTGLIAKHQPELMIYENSPYLKRAVMNNHFRNLLKVIAGLELVCYQKNLPKQEINNATRKKINQNWGKTGKIPGLVYDSGKWSFKDKSINEHEKDALLCFYLYWTRIGKKDWPFA